MRGPLGRNGWSGSEAKDKERKMGQPGVHLCELRGQTETRPDRDQVSEGVSKASAAGQARVSWPDHETGGV
jgi:hypothetical protein